MVFFYSNNPPRTTPMTTTISLESTRLEILLEVTEDRGIESGRWDLEQQNTLLSVERVGVDLRKKRTGEWGSRKSVLFVSFLCSRRVWEKCLVGGHEGGWVKATQRVPRIWREEYESIHIHIHTQTPDSTFHIQKARIHGGIKCRSPPSLPGTPTLLLDKLWNASKSHSQKLELTTLKHLPNHVQDEFDMACTWRRSKRFLMRYYRNTCFLQHSPGTSRGSWRTERRQRRIRLRCLWRNRLKVRKRVG